MLFYVILLTRFHENLTHFLQMDGVDNLGECEVTNNPKQHSRRITEDLQVLHDTIRPFRRDRQEVFDINSSISWQLHVFYCHCVVCKKEISVKRQGEKRCNQTQGS